MEHIQLITIKLEDLDTKQLLELRQKLIMLNAPAMEHYLVFGHRLDSGYMDDPAIMPLQGNLSMQSLLDWAKTLPGVDWIVVGAVSLRHNRDEEKQVHTITYNLTRLDGALNLTEDDGCFPWLRQAAKSLLEVLSGNKSAVK